MSLAAASSRDNHFNLIRMIAATGVLVSHAFPISLGPGAGQPFQQTLQGAALGAVSVYVFFAISGYFIAQSFARSDDPWRFVMARILRLFPALAVVLLLTVAVSGVWLTTASPAGFWSAAPAYLARNLTLFSLKPDLPGVFVDNPFGPAINGSLWTLNYEVLCYLGVFVAGVAGLLRLGLVVTVIVIAVMAAQAAMPYVTIPSRLARLVELGLPFAIGTWLFVWRDRIVLDRRLVAAMALASVAAWWTPLFHVVFVTALSYAVFWLGCAPAPRIARYNRLGDYSYGMYIYAFPIQQLIAWHGVTDPLWNMALAAPAALACAVASWTLIEAPALRLKRPARRAAGKLAS